MEWSFINVCNLYCNNNTLTFQLISDQSIFREFELVTEDEVLPSEDKEEKSEKDRLEEYQSLVKLPHMKGLDDNFTEEELDKAAKSETEDDKQFLKFKTRIQHEPSQVCILCIFQSELESNLYF